MIDNSLEKKFSSSNLNISSACGCSCGCACWCGPGWDTSACWWNEGVFEGGLNQDYKSSPPME